MDLQVYGVLWIGVKVFRDAITHWAGNLNSGTGVWPDSSCQRSHPRVRETKNESEIMIYHNRSTLPNQSKAEDRPIPLSNARMSSAMSAVRLTSECAQCMSEKKCCEVMNSN